MIAIKYLIDFLSYNHTVSFVHRERFSYYIIPVAPVGSISFTESGALSTETLYPSHYSQQKDYFTIFRTLPTAAQIASLAG